jgi:hypothetical protein
LFDRPHPARVPGDRFDADEEEKDASGTRSDAEAARLPQEMSSAEEYLRFQESTSSLVYLQRLVQELRAYDDTSAVSPTIAAAPAQSPTYQLRTQSSAGTPRSLSPTRLKSETLLNSLPDFALEDGGERVTRDVSRFKRQEEACMFANAYASTLEPCYQLPQQPTQDEQSSFTNSADELVAEILRLQLDDSFAIGCILAELYLGKNWNDAYALSTLQQMCRDKKDD